MRRLIRVLVPDRRLRAVSIPRSTTTNKTFSIKRCSVFRRLIPFPAQSLENPVPDSAPHSTEIVAHNVMPSRRLVVAVPDWRVRKIRLPIRRSHWPHWTAPPAPFLHSSRRTVRYGKPDLSETRTELLMAAFTISTRFRDAPMPPAVLLLNRTSRPLYRATT